MKLVEKASGSASKLMIHRDDEGRLYKMMKSLLELFIRCLSRKVHSHLNIVEFRKKGSLSELMSHYHKLQPALWSHTHARKASGCPCFERWMDKDFWTLAVLGAASNLFDSEGQRKNHDQVLLAEQMQECLASC